jgi:hypothetical protein
MWQVGYDRKPLPVYALEDSLYALEALGQSDAKLTAVKCDWFRQLVTRRGEPLVRHAAGYVDRTLRGQTAPRIFRLITRGRAAVGLFGSIPARNFRLGAALAFGADLLQFIVG